MMKYAQRDYGEEGGYQRRALESPNKPSTQSVAKKVKNYVFMLDDVIGKGSFSTVYRGQHQITHQTVAIKVIDLKRMQSETLTELLNSQVKTLQSLNHPNILHCQDIYFSASNCYIITEFCDGGDIKGLLNKEGPLDQQAVSKIILQVFEGLKYLSERNIVHRDFKTTNVLMCNGRAKIGDFGFAKKSKQIFKDVIVGSPLCMSPEGIIHNIYGPKTDVWAFGIFMYQLLHHKNPYYFCQLQEELKHAVLQPIKEADLRAGISPELKRLILSCLQIDPNNRISIQQIQYSPYIIKIKEQNANSQLLVSIVEEYKPEKQASIVSTQAPTSNGMLYRNYLIRENERRIETNKSQSKAGSVSKNSPLLKGRAGVNKSNLFGIQPEGIKMWNNPKDEKVNDSIQNIRSRSYNNREVSKIANKTLTTPQSNQSKLKNTLSPIWSSKMVQNVSEFRDLVSLLHYSRLLFKTIKLCQKHVILNIDALTSWLFQFLNQIIENINKLPQLTPNVSELKRIAHEYYVRYDNQLIYTNKFQYNPLQIKGMIEETLNVLKLPSTQARRDPEINEGIRYLSFLSGVTELLNKAVETRNYKYFTHDSEIEGFLNSKPSKTSTLRTHPV